MTPYQQLYRTWELGDFVFEQENKQQQKSFL